MRTIFETIKRVGDYVLEGKLIVRGSAQFTGPNPWVDPTHPKFGASTSLSDNRRPLQAAIDELD